MSIVSKTKKKLGRPPQEPRVKVNLLLLPRALKQIDREVCGEKPSRGKVVESKFVES